MPTNIRRPARGQTLPESESILLTTLTPLYRDARALTLYTNGWTLRAIGEAFIPPKPRSTVKSWIDRATDTVVSEHLVDAPLPEPPPRPEPTNPVSPGISPYDQSHILKLSLVARKYRSGMSPQHAAALANNQLTSICKDFRSKDVTIRELAAASEVTYRAMAKRLDK